MAKRSATTDLNHDNWNDEETPEEPGTFTKASSEALEKRVMKTAKRRLNSGEAGKSAFSTFAGFNTTGKTNTTSQFNFLSNFNSTNTTNKPSSTTNGSPNTTKNGTNEAKSSSSLFSKETQKSSPKKTKEGLEKTSTYYSKLKGLNEGVSQWIKKHVDASPFCILTPIFRDYEKYLKEIEALKPKEENESPEEKASEAKKSPTKTNETAIKVSESSSIFSGIKTSSNSDVWKSEKSSFYNTSSAMKSIFVKTESNKSSDKLFTSADSESNPFFKKPKVTSSEDNTKTTDTSTTSSIFSVNAVNPATFSFGQSSVVTSSAGFSFGGGKPFTFGAQVAKPAADTNKGEGEEEEKNEDEEPPKPDFKPVTEEGSVFEQRCKVFVKKDGVYGDRGVGTLFLKPTPNDKMQLIVRAVNSLGNLLVNTLLTPTTPIQKIKENTVQLICIPMPDAQPPPTSVLFRVKTKEDCDILIEALKKHTK